MGNAERLNSPMRSNEGQVHIRYSLCASIDKVYAAPATTAHIFVDAIEGLVASAVKGVNATVFAYGQTASGKTFTIRGNDACPGFIPLAIEKVFKEVAESREQKFKLSVAFMELYNETINDLLTDTAEKLEIKEGAGGVSVKGLTSVEINSVGEAMKLLKEGDARKKVGETKANLQSSRSHTLFRICIDSSPLDAFSPLPATCSHLTLVDLAGSESVSRTKAEGARLREGSATNKSLLALSGLMQKLSSNSGKHVSSRESKLTRMLQGDLSGNARMSIVCTVSKGNYAETLSTVQFGVRARKVKNCAKVNTVVLDASAKYQIALQEIQVLKEELNFLREDNRQVRLMMMKSAATEQVCMLEHSEDKAKAEFSKIIEDLNKINEEIRRENVDLKTELEDKASKLVKAENQIMELSRAIIEKEQQLEAVESLKHSSINSLSDRKHLHRNTKTFDNTTLSVIKENSKSSLCNKSTNQLRSPYETPSRRITFHDELMNSYSLKTDLSKMRYNEVCELKKQLEDYENQIRNHEALKQHHEHLIRKYELNTISLAKDLERAKIECRESTETVKKAIGEKMQMMISCESLQTKCESLAKEVAELLAAKQSENKKVCEEKVDSEELSNHKRILAQTRREVLDKEIVINSLVEDGKRMKERCEELVRENDALSLRAHNLSMHQCPKVGTVQTELKEKKKVIKNLRDEQYKWLDEKRKLLEELESLQEKLKDSENQLEQANGKNSALVTKLKALEAKASQFFGESCKNQNAKRKIFTAFGAHSDLKAKRKKTNHIPADLPILTPLAVIETSRNCLNKDKTDSKN